jgi:hypothetical protein
MMANTGAYLNALREEATRDELFEALADAKAENERLRDGMQIYEKIELDYRKIVTKHEAEIKQLRRVIWCMGERVLPIGDYDPSPLCADLQ